MVLKAIAFLIPDESFQNIKPKEIAILILAVILHDIGMHTEFSTFKALIGGKYDKVRIESLDKKNWRELWLDYLLEAKHFNSRQLESIFGNCNEIIKEPDLSNKDSLTGVDKKLIGEFLRRHHARLAHEIALKGIIGDNQLIPFGSDKLSIQDRQFIRIVARSHGMNIRNTFSYLEEIAFGVWKNPANMNLIFLMILLRIADYLQIESKRTDPTLLKLKTFNSPVSIKEHKTHLSISHLTYINDDPELIYVTCEPEDAEMYVKLQNLIEDIQQELDQSWNVLGEICNSFSSSKARIKFRRIDSNLKNPRFLENLKYIPQKIAFNVNSDVAKLLIAPLYGNNPSYAVRELVQNATDACQERKKIEQDQINATYKPLVEVSIDKINENKYLFKIKDNGKGMTLEEIQNYFLSVGSSFRNSYEWKKEFEGKVVRNGKFGIGVLAAFLLGDEILVQTKSYKENISYRFNAKLNNEYIEVEKLVDSYFEIGTEIKISMTKEFAKYFSTEKERSLLSVEWTDWYLGDIPVNYYVNDEKVQPDTEHNISLKEGNYDIGDDFAIGGYDFAGRFTAKVQDCVFR